MKIVFIGDIVGKEARNAVTKKISLIKEKYSPDIIIANAENSASGYGLTKKIALDLFDSGIDALTLGNHAWDQKEMLSFIEECPKIIRAINYPEGVPGKGFYEINLEDGRRIIIVQVMLRLFIGISLDDPFSVFKNYLNKEKLGVTCQAIIVDVHGEATSEKNAFGHFFDGKVSAILGTHTHIPTADAKLLSGGTAYQTDVGMSGDYDSVIGMEKENPIHGFVKGYRAEGRFLPAKGNITVCGAYIETDDETGFAKKILPFQLN
ncbi:MAG: TIGR00282 family metallophosphoesterase [Pelagibacteraceae bacterium]|nr:TIGR00282 family metallophosphoesterase [Pelagibacteraceae bacterium]|tara:strand:+ start:13884 stop:14675 length:792 start_codon:yes stop_codon:yes gene_type:complete